MQEKKVDIIRDLFIVSIFPFSLISKMKEILLISTSRTHNTGYLEHCKQQIITVLNGRKNILFIPYARPSGIDYNTYTNNVRNTLSERWLNVKGIHEEKNTLDAVHQAESIFIWWGNTFLLLKTLYDNQLIDSIKNKVNEGVPYIGTSAWSNVAWLTIHTTNDMPIVYPPSFEAIGLVPFIINPHYLDTDPNSTHMGEPRDTRIQEYLELNNNPHTVVWLREGSMLHIKDKTIYILWNKGVKIFNKWKEVINKEPGETLDWYIE